MTERSLPTSDRPVRVLDGEEFCAQWRAGAWDLAGASGRAGAQDGPESIREAVGEIIDDVKRRGRDALLDWTERFDGVRLEELEIPPACLRAAAARVPPELRRAMEAAAERISEFATRAATALRPVLARDAAQVLTAADDGPETGEYWLPLASAGLYVPGGRAPYPSSVLMTALPAKAAGVAHLVMATPPRRGQLIAPPVAAAALLSGVDRVFSLGGVQAIAALSLGAGGVPRVDKIVGPGNAYVTEAKRQLYGTTGIDGLAGPSEVLAVSSRHGGEADLAAQLLAQAEHDPDALSLGVLIGSLNEERVVQALVEGLRCLPSELAATARQSLAARGGLIRVPDAEGALQAVREVCPEHLWVDLGGGAPEAEFVLRAAAHSGAVFVGPYSPVAFGDYIAGPSHVLPTGRSARWASPLGPADFMRRVSLVRLGRRTAGLLASSAATLARAEGFLAHERSCLRAAQDTEVR